jgi:hypothetical protein
MSDITERGPAYGLRYARVMVPSGSTLTPVDLFYPNQATVSPQSQTIAFEGGDRSQTVDAVSRIDVALTCAKQDADSLQQIFAKTKVSGPGTAVWSMAMGDPIEQAGHTVGLQLGIVTKDESVSPAVAYLTEYYYLKGTLKMLQPQNAQYQTAHTMVLNFSFEQTAVDAANQPVAAVPSGSSAFYLLSRKPLP